VPERAVNRGHQRPARRPENDPPHGARPGRSAPAAKRSPKQSAVLNLIVSAESAASRPSRTRSLRKLLRDGHDPTDGSYRGGRRRSRARKRRSPDHGSPGHWRAINPVTGGLSRSLTVTRGHPALQVRPCGRPGRRRFPS
jgi:hypothetical protein